MLPLLRLALGAFRDHVRSLALGANAHREKFRKHVLARQAAHLRLVLHLYERSVATELTDRTFEDELTI